MAGDLHFDVSNDLQQIDGAVSRLINDQALWAHFLTNPSKVMSEIGWHPPTTDEIHERVNKFMYAAMTNIELINALDSHYKDFSPERINEYNEFFLAGLRKGTLQNKLDYDHDALEHFIADRDFARHCYLLVLKDLNAKNLLQNRYTDDELEKFVDASIDALAARKPLAEHPVLEHYDENYKVGFGFGAVPVEFDLPVTVVAPVEFAVPATVAGQAPNIESRFRTAEFTHSETAMLTLNRLTELYRRLAQQASEHRF